MNVNFYKFNKRINSTKQPSGTSISKNVVLKSPCSIINPILELSELLDVNYCYIANFGRFYFINNINFENGRYLYELTSDVLASAKTEIGNSNLFVLRSASQFDGEILDENIIIRDSYSQVFNTINSENAMSDGYVVLGILGQNQNRNGMTYYETNLVGYGNLISQLLTTADGYDWGDLSQGAINSIMNPFQYIESARWYPRHFDIIDGSQQNIKAGLWESQTQGAVIDNTSSQTDIITNSGRINIPKHPSSGTRGDFLNLKPFSKYSLISPYFGTIDLDNSLLADKSLLFFSRTVDYTTGMARIIFTASTSAEAEKVEVARAEFPFGVDLPIEKREGSSFLGMIAGAGMTAFGAYTGNPELIGQGMAGLVGSAVKELSPSISIRGGAGGILAHVGTMGLRAIFYDINEEDVVHKGRALAKNRTLSTLSGFIQCQTGEIECDLTENEKQQITNYLTSGFYYE